MNNYWHMMEQAQMSERKKEEIMNMLENSEKRTQKRRMPRMGKVILASALAVGCVLSIAAGLPAQVYNFMSGGSVSITDHGNTTTVDSFAWDLNGEQAAPIVLEDGKLWFVNGDERTDLTGLIDENTPYIYEHTDPATGNKGYFVAGGTPEKFGWAEFPVVDGAVSAVSGSKYEDWWYTEAGACSMQGQNYADSYLTIDGVRQPSYEMSEELVEKLNHDPSYELSSVNHPWLDAALDQLSLDI